MLNTQVLMKSMVSSQVPHLQNADKRGCVKTVDCTEGFDVLPKRRLAAGNAPALEGANNRLRVASPVEVPQIAGLQPRWCVSTMWLSRCARGCLRTLLEAKDGGRQTVSKGDFQPAGRARAADTGHLQTHYKAVGAGAPVLPGQPARPARSCTFGGAGSRGLRWPSPAPRRRSGCWSPPRGTPAGPGPRSPAAARPPSPHMRGAHGSPPRQGGRARTCRSSVLWRRPPAMNPATLRGAQAAVADALLRCPGPPCCRLGVKTKQGLKLRFFVAGRVLVGGSQLGARLPGKPQFWCACLGPGAGRGRPAHAARAIGADVARGPVGTRSGAAPGGFRGPSPNPKPECPGWTVQR